MRIAAFRQAMHSHIHLTHFWPDCAVSFSLVMILYKNWVWCSASCGSVIEGKLAVCCTGFALGQRPMTTTEMK